MNDRDEALLRDMLDAAYEALHFSAGKTRSSLDEERILALALVKLMEIIR